MEINQGGTTIGRAEYAQTGGTRYSSVQNTERNKAAGLVSRAFNTLVNGTRWLENNKHSILNGGESLWNVYRP